MAKTRIRGIIYAAQLAILLAISAQIIIPLPLIPFTAQTLAVGILATISDIRLSTWAIGGYLLLGLVGLPVFAGGTAGLGVLFGPSGGYLWAFFVQAWLISLVNKKADKYLIVGNLVGAFSQLVIGAIWLKFTSQLGWQAALTAGITPFLIPAVIKAVLAALIGQLLLRRLREPLQLR
ncbi:biotin transporter BioY [Paucilactobacillus wasatchensis]|uniref:Biotin transporter n=1 Tax=Paucilactobacillus wasatchensis TaxID=1335616 RepID=A0A0D1AB89_9LACO|nr:biotin transporter BioY [Paucilactobacillus wasatchensis]KIS03976.1 Substrate-specific component BioY of biotin ECF transporter [Paucilactobacillus wasatchensis]